MLTQVAGHHMNVIKVIPPLVVEESDLERFATALDETVAATEPFGRAMTRFTLGMARRSLGRVPSPTGSAPPAGTV